MVEGMLFVKLKCIKQGRLKLTNIQGRCAMLMLPSFCVQTLQVMIYLFALNFKMY